MPTSRRKVYFATDLDGNDVKTRFADVLKRYDEATSHEEAEFIVFDLHHLPEEFFHCMPEKRTREVEADLDHHSLPCFLVQLRRSKLDRRSAESRAPQQSEQASTDKRERGSRGSTSTTRRGIRNDVKKLLKEYNRVFEVEPRVSRTSRDLLAEMMWFENMIPFRRKQKEVYEETCENEVIHVSLSLLKEKDGSGKGGK